MDNRSLMSYASVYGSADDYLPRVGMTNDKHRSWALQPALYSPRGEVMDRVLISSHKRFSSSL